MDTLLIFFASIRWQDFVDVVLNSYILFRLYVLFRETNVIRVIAGIALLWVFQRLAAGLGLIFTSWAMQGIIAVAALIIIIVFRNEIRNVLQAKNLRAILWDFPNVSSRTPIDSIVEGAYDLAYKHIGALIVLPGKEDINENIQGGIDWQGKISKDMLMSVFWPGNPVHDGAAIIIGDRMTRVGTILPLSRRDDLPRKYGTRHRAALGLTEHSDALAIAVSEERGQVTVAKQGEITPIGDDLALRQIVLAHLGLSTEPEAKTRRDFIKLAAAPLVCLFIMAGIWFSFTRGLETLTSFEVPLEYISRDVRLQIVSTSENTVRLHLSGSGALINSMKPEQVKVQLDLNNAVNGENTFTITSDNIALPPGVRLNRIEPPEVRVVLDLPITRELPLQVDWVGNLPPGKVLQAVQLIPERVEVVGASQILNQISTIYTEKIHLENLQKSGQMIVNLALEPASLKISDQSEEKVEVRYVIARRSVAGSR